MNSSGNSIDLHFLNKLKENGLILDYKVKGDIVYLQPIKPVEEIVISDVEIMKYFEDEGGVNNETN